MNIQKPDWKRQKSWLSKWQRYNLKFRRQKNNSCVMYEFLLSTFQHPLALALFILLGTYLLEDAAIVTAALLTADGLISSELAFLVLCIGIFSGDLGLYGLGVLLKRVSCNSSHYIFQIVSIDRVEKAGGWLKKRMAFTVLFVRVIPGLRLPAYTACGFFNLPFLRFMMLVLVASVVWTGIIYFGLYGLGSMFWSELGLWKWLLLPVIFLLIFYGHRSLSSLNGVLK